MLKINYRKLTWLNTVLWPRVEKVLDKMLPMYVFEDCDFYRQ